MMNPWKVNYYTIDFTFFFQVNLNLIINCIYFVVDDEDNKLMTLIPLTNRVAQPHNTVFVNELKLSDFKQVLSKSSITSEFSGGVLWCSNGTIAIRRVSKEAALRFYFNFYLILDRHW